MGVGQVREILGSYTNGVGLPLAETVAVRQQRGAVQPAHKGPDHREAAFQCSKRAPW